MKRQHDDAIKEINQAMTVRIKASKDIKRLTEERNAAMQVRVGIQIRNMKMDFNFHCTWRWVTFEKLLMKIYDFFYWAKSLSHPV